MVAAHHQAGRGGARPTHLAWNWRDIHRLLGSSDCVKLYLAGHDHMGGYTWDSGVHWLTIEAVLEGDNPVTTTLPGIAAGRYAVLVAGL